MEENLLKYFTNNNNYTTEIVQPTNIDNGIVSDLPSMEYFRYSMVTNDGNYFIRYGGYPHEGNYNAIEVYNNDSIKSGQPLNIFSNLTIYGHTFTVQDMKQDEDGRFYAVGEYYPSDEEDSEQYLILFNNFIQDGYCQIRKFYTSANMGIVTETINESFTNVAKKEGSADYYIYAFGSFKIYHFKIYILKGNSLDTYNLVDDTTVMSGSWDYNFNIVNDSLILNALTKDDNGNVSLKKLIINLSEEVKSSYAINEVLYKPIGSNILIGYQVSRFKYYLAYYEPFQNGNYNLIFEKIDLNGNTRVYSDNLLYQYSNDEMVSFSESYITFVRKGILELFYYDSARLTRFYSTSFYGGFLQIQELKQYNLINLVGLNTANSLVYSMNVNSVGYSSTPYLNKNFLIPQYLNLYATASDNTSLIYSRDVINRFLAGNQLTTTFNVPNYLLNNTNINRETVYGQTNLAVTDNVKVYTKNRFESLYLTYMYGIQIIDNTNENNLLNTTGSNRLANSVWNLLDDTDTACLKARITYEDGLQTILTLDTTNISTNTCTLEYEVTGNVRKIEYLSNDEQTIYATYRCNLTGTNMIKQTITIS